ncbi:hypothetical protein HY415_01960 [Candidatus Kaiserbacteria bacterium]|nr:hypothetical protein [Candidatus Kaiserbacteria bacterium]
MGELNTIHQHPQDAEEMVVGRRLQPGEKLKEGDVYDSEDGTWKPVPKQFIGSTVKGNYSGTLIRPAG